MPDNLIVWPISISPLEHEFLGRLSRSGMHDLNQHREFVSLLESLTGLVLKPMTWWVCTCSCTDDETYKIVSIENHGEAEQFFSLFEAFSNALGGLRNIDS